MDFGKYVKQFDYFLIFILTSLFVIGMLAISSATNVHTEGINREFQVQLISFFIGIVFIIALQFIDYELLGNLYIPIYIFSISLLFLVYIPGLGVTQNGANSWIDLGPLFFQPSEVTKIGYIIFLAKYLEKNDGIKNILDVLKVLFTLAPIMVLILRQPDLGTALVFIVITFGMMFVAGFKYRYIIIGSIAGVVAYPFIYNILKPHQQVRLDSFLDPDNPELEGYYQVMQSKVTIGSGQFYGKGIFKGIYHRYNYLPVQESDFIFAVWVEETGFVGGAAVIGLYFLFLTRLVYISMKVKDAFASYIVIGVLAMFTFQIVENIGMTIGVMPVTGVTLPFISYGGTSILTCMIAIGLVETVYIRRKKGQWMS